jgi:adenine deaminase
MSVGERIMAARGLRPPDLVLKRGRVANVFTGEVEAADVAIHDGYIVGIGEYPGGRAEIDLDGAHVTPGLIDGHMHKEYGNRHNGSSQDERRRGHHDAGHDQPISGWSRP